MVIEFAGEDHSNRVRKAIAALESPGQRTWTPTQAVLAHAEGIYVYTPEGRRLVDFTSGVLVTNLGHHPKPWLDRWLRYLEIPSVNLHGEGFVRLPPWTAYNAISTLEELASRRLIDSLQRTPYGEKLTKVLWSASGSEGIHKAITAAWAFRPDRRRILATRHGFHGKKGLAGAVTGDETASERDPRVHFISFPQKECQDLVEPGPDFDPEPYEREIRTHLERHPREFGIIVTEPYLGGGGSFHPPKAYHALLQRIAAEFDLLIILDEVQSNFGRTGQMYAFETYEIRPDLVVLGKGMANGVPINAVAGRRDVLDALRFGEASDTWSGNPMGCAAVLATLDEFEQKPILKLARAASERIEAGLRKLRDLEIVAAVRGEGMVWGIEMAPFLGVNAATVAGRAIAICYQGDARETQFTSSARWPARSSASAPLW